MGIGYSSNTNAGLDTDVVTVVGDLGAIDLNISNKPESDTYTTFAFFSNYTRFKTPRGDTINYVVSLSNKFIETFKF